MKICVLSGGVSNERKISLLTGRAVRKALREAGHEVRFVDLRGEKLSTIPKGTEAVFLAMHGRFGEDGTIQKMLERKGLRYTGSGPAASALAMDKVEARRRFARKGISVAPGIALRRGGKVPPAAQIARRIGPCPWFVKPAREGSSIGVTRVEREEQLAKALADALAKGSRVLVEKGVEGRELTVGILGGEALPLVELKPKRAFYDYRAKYARGSGTEYVVKPDLPAQTVRAVQEAGLAAFRSLGCRGYGRVDVMLDFDGIPHVLEVNTIPGMTERSLLPMAAAAAGLDFPALCERIVELALQQK